jgi:hypothetical protein
MTLISRVLLVAAALLVAALAFCGVAGAANVVVGPSLTGTQWVESGECPIPSCTFVNSELNGTGANVTSPVTGAIVKFSVVGGSTTGTYRLRTASRLGASAVFVFKDISAPLTAVPNAGIQTYPTSLPVTAGQSIGLTAGEGASFEFAEVGEEIEWGDELPESGQSPIGGRFPGVAGFNAEIQPAPAIGALSVASGPTAGGTAVTITGTDLEGATAVSFGSAPATVTADSETQIAVVAPASATAATAPVSVTTIAGTASGPVFTYVAAVVPILKKAPVAHCVVPNLKGKNLKAAKRSLVKGKCKLGTVKKLGGATPKSGKVAKQGSKAGAKLAAGAKVAVTLEPAKAAGKKHKK